MIGMIEFSNVMAYPFSRSETTIQSYSSHLVLYYETCVLIVYSHPVLINFRKKPTDFALEFHHFHFRCEVPGDFFSTPVLLRSGSFSSNS